MVTPALRAEYVGTQSGFRHRKPVDNRHTARRAHARLSEGLLVGLSAHSGRPPGQNRNCCKVRCDHESRLKLTSAVRTHRVVRGAARQWHLQCDPNWIVFLPAMRYYGHGARFFMGAGGS